MMLSTRRVLALGVGVMALVAGACGSGDARSGGGSGGTGTGGAGAAGADGFGGRIGTGGMTSSGGRSGTGGGGATGTLPGTGGGSGGASGTGGVTGAGGRSAAGGGGGSGGVSGAGGTTAVDGGVATCKRGIAANTTPGSGFFPAVGWWYNWAVSSSGSKTGIEFVPMIWGSGSLKSALPSGARFLLTFNEPNFYAQANLSAAEAASYWPTIESKAAGIPIVGPGMNFCGPADQCHGTDPYLYLKDFFAACTGCQVDYVAAHWYNCDLPSLKEYLEGGRNLAGYEQFDRPVWLTEFSCDGSASVAQQEAYMRVAIPYLDGNPKVFRYAWFSADPIPNAKLMGGDGSPTALGQVYIGLPGACQ